MSQNRTETDVAWSNNVGLQESLSFTMCCEDTEGIKEAERILGVPHGPHGDCQVAQRRNVLKGKGQKTGQFGTKLVCRN